MQCIEDAGTCVPCTLHSYPQCSPLYPPHFPLPSPLPLSPLPSTPTRNSSLFPPFCYHSLLYPPPSPFSLLPFSLLLFPSRFPPTLFPYPASSLPFTLLISLISALNQNYLPPPKKQKSCAHLWSCLKDINQCAMCNGA